MLMEELADGDLLRVEKQSRHVVVRTGLAKKGLNADGFFRAVPYIDNGNRSRFVVMLCDDGWYSKENGTYKQHREYVHKTFTVGRREGRTRGRTCGQTDILASVAPQRLKRKRKGEKKGKKKKKKKERKRETGPICNIH